jgi:Rad51 protein
MMERIPTECKAIDTMVAGGLATGTVTQIFGEKALGKSLLSFQTAYATAVAGNSAIIIDTEQSYHSYLMDPWKERMAKRFGKEIPIVEVSLHRRSTEDDEEREKPKKDRRRHIPKSVIISAISSALNHVNVPYSQAQLDNATDIFAADLYVDPYEVGKEPSIVLLQVPEVADLLGLHGVEAEKIVSAGGRVELHLLRTPSYLSVLHRVVRDTKAKLLVYDSISAPFKASFPSTQDLPARSAGLAMMLSHAQRLCVEFGIAVIVVNHVSVDPIQHDKTPYGGAILGYESKFSLELTGPGANREDDSVAVNLEDKDPKAKKVWMARHPAFAPYARFGYLRIDEEGVH